MLETELSCVDLFDPSKSGKLLYDNAMEKPNTTKVIVHYGDGLDMLP